MDSGDKTSEEDEVVVNLNHLAISAGKFLVLLIALALCMRIPLIWLKIPVAVGAIYLGWNWIWRSAKLINSSSPLSKGKKAEFRQDYQAAIKFYEKAAGRPPRPGYNSVRLLVAYDKAGEFGRAKALIQHFDGKEFPESEEDELRAVVSNYFPVELQRSLNGVRMKLL